MTLSGSKSRKRLTREAALLLILLFVGIAVLPIAIYAVGNTIFGAYDGAGFFDFFGSISARLRSGDLAAWFLALSPYLGCQALRLTYRGWRYASTVPAVAVSQARSSGKT